MERPATLCLNKCAYLSIKSYFTAVKTTCSSLVVRLRRVILVSRHNLVRFLVAASGHTCGESSRITKARCVGSSVGSS